MTLARGSTTAHRARVGLHALAALAVLVTGCARGTREDPDANAHPGRDTGVRDGGPDTATDTGIKPDVGTDSGADAGPVCVDTDGDGFGAGCSGGPDCDDTNANVSPAGTEVCNGLDDNCDGSTDEGLDTPVFCGVGACRTSVPQCASGSISTCTPLPPGTEICNGIDDNCDGNTDEGFGGTTCGIGACQMTVAACTGGMPPACVPGSPTTEICNGIDDDCDGTPDDGLGNTSCGRGLCTRSVPACSGGVPGICTPGSPTNESCNGMDDNCNGSIDEGCVTCTPPGNTSCGSAAAYAIGSTVMGDNTCSGPDVGATCGGNAAGNDVAYTFVSDGSPTHYAFTMTGAAGYDTVLHAHTSSACTTADQLACDDDGAGYPNSLLQLDAPPQGTVFLVADSYSTTGASTFTLTSSTSALNNDTCSSPIAIRANGTYTGNTATRSHQYVPSCDGSFLGNTAPDVVYSITARTSGSITATLCGSGYDTILYVSTSCGSDSGGCNDDSCGLQSSVTFSTTAGTTYYLVVDGYASSSGPYTLNITGY